MRVNIITKFLIIISVPLIVVIGRIYNISTWVTSIYIPVFFILSLFSKKNGYFLKYTPIRLYLLFFLISLASIYNAINTEVFLGEVKTQIGCIIFGIAIFNYIIINPTNIKYFFFSCILTTYAFALYLFSTGSVNLRINENLDYRIDDETFNANMFPYYIFLSSFSFFFLFQLQKKRIFEYIYLLSLPLYLYIILSSGSRGGLIIFLLIQIIYWFYIGFGNVKSFAKSTVRLTLSTIIALPLLIYMITNMMEETNIGRRFNALSEEGENTIRIVLAKLAIEKFKEYPFLGVGSGQFRLHNQYNLFSHNNFIEILVNNGIFSLIIYLMIFIVTLGKTLSFKKKTNNIKNKKSANVIILFILGFTLYSFFYVFANVIPFTGFIFSIFALIYIMNYNVNHEAGIE
ncbi:MAG: O-antigen ligase family protein [Chitinophagaceae bacterium]|nr:O-antigen ligase family protein [Chitinophagaceae bacterium]